MYVSEKILVKFGYTVLCRHTFYYERDHTSYISIHVTKLCESVKIGLATNTGFFFNNAPSIVLHSTVKINTTQIYVTDTE